MRPGRFHPGNNEEELTPKARPSDSFNEAGAFPPRKSRWCIGLEITPNL